MMKKKHSSMTKTSVNSDNTAERATPQNTSGFPIVGMGASAGGLAAFEAFFSGMPAHVDPGIAFVLVQHLAPDHKSLLCELIRRCTRMQVFEVRDGMLVQANCVYIIPPNHDMALLNGVLHLLDPVERRGQRLPIDYFFRSLAVDQRERAISIIFSGTGSDGTLGIRAIKSEGGMVMVQQPDSTEFDGMPRSALATGLVDFEILPAEMPAKLISYVAHSQLSHQSVVTAPPSEGTLKKIFVLLRAQTGHDFSQYKLNTLQRRIERRMAVHQLVDVDPYVKFLQQTPVEVEALFRDLLIGVTNFFRDPEAFQELGSRIIPTIFANKPAGGTIRVWSVACSTGEEAYSLAILFTEYMDTLKQRYELKIFATDMDSRAIATARTGRYPASIAAEVSPERLARFFTAEHHGGAYRVHKSIRDTLVFSEHDVIRDPPFSKLDLISCRNLLIYFNLELQQRLIPQFHYALNSKGILFLGTSEGIGDFDNLFATFDRKAKLYQREDDYHDLRRLVLGRAQISRTGTHDAIGDMAGKKNYPVKPSLRELTEQALLRQMAPIAALVNGQGDVLYLYGRAGLYLEPSPGESGINNILKMAREGLRPDLTITLRKAAISKSVERAMGISVKTNGHFTRVNLSVSPVMDMLEPLSESALFLIVFEPAEPVTVEAALSVPDELASVPIPMHESEIDARIVALQGELRAKDAYLQATHEELETSNEELKSANEEMQSVNEELQSSNEELETAKEEMQSVNEELVTVNTELQAKLADLSRANNDMNNLLAGTGIATVFVDFQLRILRFTPTIKQVVNLMPSDVGRPLSDFVSKLVGYDRMMTDTQAVLDTLVPKSMEVLTREANWFAINIQPYRTLDNVIEGAVLSFVDITQTVKARDALRLVEKRYHAVVSALSEGILARTRDGELIAANPSAECLLGVASGQLSENVSFNPRWQVIHEDGSEFSRDMYPAAQVLRTGVAQSNVIMGLRKPDDDVCWLSVNAVPIFESGNDLPAAVAESFSDISDRKRTEELRRNSDEWQRLAAVVRDSQDAITVQDLDGHILAWNPGAVRLYGWSEAEALRMNVSERIPDEFLEDESLAIIQLSQTALLLPRRTQRLTKSKTLISISITATALRDENNKLYAVATTERPLIAGDGEGA